MRRAVVRGDRLQEPGERPVVAGLQHRQHRNDADENAGEWQRPGPAYRRAVEHRRGVRGGGKQSCGKGEREVVEHFALMTEKVTLV